MFAWDLASLLPLENKTTAHRYKHNRTCTKPTETLSTPVSLKQKTKCCTEEVPQDALPCSKHCLQPPIDSFPEELHTHAVPSTKGKVGCSIPGEQ